MQKKIYYNQGKKMSIQTFPVYTYCMYLKNKENLFY